jgi:hypothetical protein
MRGVLTTLLIAGLLLACPVPVRAADPLVDRVQKAMDQAIKFLRLQSKEKGHWDHLEIGGQVLRPGGWTSLATLALLNAGVPREDEIIQKSLVYLRTIPPSQTYVVGLQTMVFAQAGYPEDLKLIQRNVDWLLQARLANGWSYGKLAGAAGTLTDFSNTQYALLGLHEGIQAGATVPQADLQAIQKIYLDTQVNGGWGYRRTDAPTMTMTTAGVCGLFITGMDLAQGQQQLRPDGSAVNCGVYADNKPIKDAMDWIGNRFPAKITPENILRFGSPFYCLYGIERTGRLSGQRFFQGHDWYRLGCEYLVDIQKGDGSWQGAPGTQTFDPQPIIATSFSLLFLSKGRTPVLITKMAHGRDETWTNKRNDLRHLTEFCSKELFKRQPLAFQLLDTRPLKAANEADLRQSLVEELLPCPIVYLTGHSLKMDDREQAILKEYLANGGFLFAEACCGEPLFDRDFRKLMDDLFKEEGAKLERVQRDHPVWTASGKFAVPPDDPYPLFGVRQGCKWIVLYSPKPLGGYFEANQTDKGNGKTAFQLGANIVAYATGLAPPPPRLSRVNLARNEATKEPVKRGYLEVGQLAHDGDWHPAPRAMRHVMESLRESGLDVILNTSRIPFSEGINLDTGDDLPPIRNIQDVRFFYLHGRREFTAGTQALKDLRFNLETGGTLLSDACCGSKVFDASFRKMVDKLFAGTPYKLEKIPPTDLLFSKALNGEAIDRVRCRLRPAEGQQANPEPQSVPPELYGVKINGRWAVIYSPYDLGCALEKHTASDCLGHDHASALKLARAAVLYSLQR